MPYSLRMGLTGCEVFGMPNLHCSLTETHPLVPNLGTVLTQHSVGRSVPDSTADTNRETWKGEVHDL